MSVTDRLGRLLFIVPYVAHRDGVTLQELAEKLGVTTAQIESDLELLAMVGQPPLTPDHLIDLYVEDDVVYVDLDQSLSRPLQLTHEEASALVLSAKLVGDLGGLGNELEAVLAKIAEHLNPAEKEMVAVLAERVGISRELPEGAVSASLRKACEASREVALEYYSASSDRHKRYRAKPLGLVSHSGIEYVVALDIDEDDHEKLFRIDRIGSVQVTDRTFEKPRDFDLARFRTQRLYFGERAFTAEVWFSKAVAREVAERFSESDVTKEADGSLKVRVSTSSPAWLARWVLPFGEDARVLSPEQPRQYIADLMASAVTAYRR